METNTASDLAWPEKSLAQLGARVTSGSRGWAKYYSDHGDLFVRITNLRRTSTRLDLDSPRYVQVDPDDAEARRTRLRPGDILVSITADIGIIGLVDETVPDPAYINQHIARVRLDPKLADSRFISYFLASWAPQRRFVGATDQGAKAGMNLTAVANLAASVPPLAEQVAIADALDTAVAQIEALERLIAKKRNIKQGLMQQLLTGQTRLPGFDARWREALLGEHVSYIRTVALSRDQLDQESPLRYLHYGDIHTRSDVHLNAAAESMPRARAGLAGRAGRLLPGDLVFADASEDPAGVGKSLEISAVPPEGVVPGLHTIAARFDKRVLADGFKAYLQFIPAFRESLLRLAAGTKVLATTRSYISSIRLLVPDIEEQRAIAAILADADAEVTALERRLKSARSIKTGMMQELLTNRTRLRVEAAS
ncbi:restriction endonuclease subunit S [Streptomyces globisporus]|uniref:Restriction endonuclease subunit S n=1 Tax=Streptomyces globisporus TaxID=1908 RepID=A0A423UYD9_STRGL|nr:restriction endonuclease subunit S [Streptomyces globisporus]